MYKIAEIQFASILFRGLSFFFECIHVLTPFLGAELYLAQ